MTEVHVDDRPNEVRVNPRDLTRVDVVEQPVYVEVAASGPQGPGLTANQIAAAVAYVHSQDASASTWTVQHNLGFHPNVTVVSSGGATVEGEISYPGLNALTLTFSSAFTGKAYLS